ncbi:MAG TPA: LLM class flavin-dependent oxidoreductase, partial [Mycobacterium sp.]|nr:LLM class flavin-dependent oxidoreductase [Mycobacterium sp.]
YHTESAINEPRYRDHIPIMLGGSGEKKTFRLAAQHADHLNIIAGMSQLAAKLEALRQRCAEVGRDPATLETTVLLTVVLDENIRPDDIPEAVRDRTLVGSPDAVAEQVRTRVLDIGVDGVIINMPVGGHEPGVVTKAGEALRPLIGA